MLAVQADDVRRVRRKRPAEVDGDKIMAMRSTSKCVHLIGVALLVLTGAAQATEAFPNTTATLPQDTSKPSRPYSLVFRGVTYSAAFQHNAGTDWFVEMTPPGETVDTWRTLLILHWFPSEKGAPEDATRHLATLADQADPRARAILTENARAQEALVYFHAFSAASHLHEGSVFKYGRTIGSNGLVAVQYSIRFDGGRKPAAANRALQSAVRAIKSFDLGQITLVNGRWGDTRPDGGSPIEVPFRASAS